MQALAGRRPSVGNKRRSSYAAGFEAQAGAGVAPSAADAIERRRCPHYSHRRRSRCF